MQKFLDALHDRVLLFDGAMGTEIQKIELPADKYPNNQAGFNDGLTLTCPKEIAAIHRSYLDAGADCIETNTFGSNRIKLDEYGVGGQSLRVKQVGRQDSGGGAASPYGDRYVVGTMGPTGYLPSSMEESLGSMPLDDIEGAFRVQVEGLAALTPS